MLSVALYIQLNVANVTFETSDVYRLSVMKLGLYYLNTILLFQELKKFLYGLLSGIEGLHSILITDRDGVPVISVADDKAPELAMRASFLSTFGMATDQGSKLGLGKNKVIICMYSNYQVKHITSEHLC